ncbi:hypothetical protein REPUB_Repub06bG0122800 [Reevesia pubescens]
MEDNIEELWEQLKLTEDESVDLFVDSSVIKKADEMGKLSLVGSLLTNRSFNQEALFSKLRRIWKLVKGVEFKVLGDNLFLFKFFARRDQCRVLEGSL